MPTPSASRRVLRTCLPLLAVLLAFAVRAPAFERGPIADPEGLGPFAAGRMTFEVVDASRGDRTLTVDAWYPVDTEEAGGPPSVYDLLFTGITSEVAFDGPPLSRRGPFPLVVFSHGSGGIRFQSYFLGETLATHGFVVVAPDHAGNTALDLIFPGPPFEPRDRPLDVSFLITRMLERSAEPGDAFFAGLDPDRIGVSGHSFGGFTSLAMAAGFEDVPPDPRVDAIVPISPVSTAFAEAELAGISIPTLILGGTADITTPVDPQSTFAFEFISARPRYRVDVRAAGHNSFTNVCDIADALLGIGLPIGLLEFLLGSLEEGCVPDLIPVEEAQRLTKRYAVAFLQRFVARDPRYQRFLTPGRSASEPDVIYFQLPGGGRSRR